MTDRIIAYPRRDRILASAVPDRILSIGQEVYVPPLNIYAPDIEGHTRYEWPVEVLDLEDLALVSEWTDVSQGLVVGQSVTASRPQYFADDGGYPSVQFDGGDDFLEGVASAIDSSSRAS